MAPSVFCRVFYTFSDFYERSEFDRLNRGGRFRYDAIIEQRAWDDWIQANVDDG